MKVILKLFIVFALANSNSHALNKEFYAIKRCGLISNDFYFKSARLDKNNTKSSNHNLYQRQHKIGKGVSFKNTNGLINNGTIGYAVAENKWALAQKNSHTNIKFQHAFFASFLGYSDGNFALSYGIGYAPRIAFIVNDDFSYNLGTHVQAILPSGSFEGIGVSMPLLVGLAYGAPSSSNTNKAMGMIFNVGLSQVLIEDSPDSIVFLGATSEIGFAFNDYMQIRLTVVSSFEDWGSTLFFSGCFGIEI
jgi:hypothetical protein